MAKSLKFNELANFHTQMSNLCRSDIKIIFISSSPTPTRTQSVVPHQRRLDQILGKQGSKAKDVYASKISLASRVVKIERQVGRQATRSKLHKYDCPQ